jgi:hypothetical protein
MTLGEDEAQGEGMGRENTKFVIERNTRRYTGAFRSADGFY